MSEVQRLLVDATWHHSKSLHGWVSEVHRLGIAAVVRRLGVDRRMLRCGIDKCETTYQQQLAGAADWLIAITGLDALRPAT